MAWHRGLDRLEVRRRNLIRAEQFPYLIPSGTTYDSGDYHAVVDKVVACADYAALVAERDRLRAQGLLVGIGMAACLEPSGANSTFEPLLNPKNETTTYTDSCRINVDVSGAVTATIHTLSAGQGHETLVGCAPILRIVSRFNHGTEPIVISLRNRIVTMVMALRAADG